MKSPTRESTRDEQQREIAIIPLGREYGSGDCQRLAEFEGRLLGAVEDSPAGLLIDLGETVYIGGGLLSVLLRLSARVRETNRRFALCALTSFPDSVIGITRLDSFWQVFRTRRDAIEAMQQRITMPPSVQQLCREKRLSLLGLAEESGLDFRRLQSIYCGRWTPSPQERVKIAGALNTPIDDIAWEHTTQVEHFYGPS